MNKAITNGPWEVTTGAENNTRLHTPFGYYNYTTDTHRWYLRNRQGSVMAVVDHDGNVLQRSGVYPGGTPFSVDYNAEATPSLTAATDRLHIGNSWMSHSGLNWYDNTARMHDPLLMRFTTPDALATDYPSLSPWAHCAGNPANLTDPDGNRVWSVDESGFFKLESETTFPDEERFILIPFSDSPKQTEERINGDFDYISLPKNSVLSYKNYDNGDKGFTVLKIRGDQNADNLYRGVSIFAVKYGAKTEFSLAKTGIAGDKGLDFLTTSHEDSTEASMSHLYANQLKFGYHIRSLSHSHPRGYDASEADVDFKNWIRETQPESWKNKIEFRIFKVPSENEELY